MTGPTYEDLQKVWEALHEGPEPKPPVVMTRDGFAVLREDGHHHLVPADSNEGKAWRAMFAATMGEGIVELVEGDKEDD